MKRFARIRMLLAMAVLAAMVAAAVAYGSPYAPVVEPVMDIEEIWAIEDARTESETPLVTRLENHGIPLGYDASENTFYCAVGMDNEEWPDIHLTAPDAKGVSLVFVDDYTYDWCSDAVMDGYAYQLMAYTDDEFFYTQIVFTGLPLVILSGEEALIPHEDVPVQVALSWDAETGLTANARAHERGDTTLRMREKHGIKVEYTRTDSGARKTQVDMPFLGRTDEFILIACAMDQLLIRDRLSWDLYNAISERSEPFGGRETCYVEVFVNDDYEGLYLLMKPFDYETELSLAGKSAAQTDSLYRLAGGSVYEFDKPLAQDHRGYYYEEHYAPEGAADCEALEPYLALLAEESNEAFCEGVMELLDIDSVIRYALFVQACGMTDNEHNNLYVHAHHDGADLTYYFYPWDLDVSWGRDDEENAEVWYPFPLFDRMVELDCGGVVRERVRAIWQEMREKAFNDANVEALIAHYNHAMGDSGAFYRDAVKWNRPNSYPDGYSTYSYAASRFAMMDRRIEEICSEELSGRYIQVEGYTTFDVSPLEEAMKENGAI